ncbi:hypothetical protein [endosymbiont GvMRE of Glomus versiforme]|uniref:hypothetical protein n=1 Tax=endosymbiont GvMRE of Glomus versiforme TaxID=2039283 RepID=UPI0011C456F8|nr:hypothetical protein [endosymbiont GvMRE of Glomus versiforme]
MNQDNTISLFVEYRYYLVFFFLAFFIFFDETDELKKIKNIEKIKNAPRETKRSKDKIRGNSLPFESFAIQFSLLFVETKIALSDKKKAGNNKRKPITRSLLLSLIAHFLQKIPLPNRSCLFILK